MTRTAMSVGKLFTYTRVPYGDDNQMVRGIIARCGAPGCEAAIPLPVNHLQNSRGADDEIEFQFISHKLEAKGWRTGRRGPTTAARAVSTPRNSLGPGRRRK